MKLHTTPITLGSGLVEVRVLAPRVGLRFGEHIGYVCRGWIDALRYRGVSDSDKTHYLHGVVRHCRRGERDVQLAVRQGIAGLELQLAVARLASARPMPSAPSAEPGVDELANLAGADRQLWVQRVRLARASRSESSAANAGIAAAQHQVVALEAEIASLAVERDDVLGQWRECFEQRAALYTRARFGWFGARVTERPQVPEYDAVGAANHAPAVGGLL